MSSASSKASSLPSSSAPSPSAPSSSIKSSAISSSSASSKPSSSAPSSSIKSSSQSASSTSSKASSLSSSSASSSSPTSTTPSSSSTSPESSSAAASSSTSSEPPTPTDDPNCEDISGNNFPDGTLAPWYISDQVTADSSGVVAEGPDGTDHAFALIPSQDQFAQVYLNQQLPRCGDPPPKVTVKVSFDYQFTGDSTGCTIGASFNRETTNFLEVADDGQSNGVWQHYAGDPSEVQLTYDSLFTLKLSCPKDTANKPAILITNIYVYP
ncbi:hypothetical protein VFPPC_13272 [Pochonia chlamydosporia 170]|uniref:Uncharacterized protein n=1 Tax=Pochonia chlamydosporia 170 TaxID=1380566 RepID=A0A179FXQ3_METCM|nr:hypothetical protein VFPPC_13272 [Pochonia chlamydosporia 170]OAQ69881.1 hypothetical protein VFPPC_13272 [Pochonia chlamydosporia 170]